MVVIVIAVLVFILFQVFVYSGVKLANRKKKILQAPFPAAWRSSLEKNVHYYRILSEAQKREFEKRVQIFLGLTRIIPVQCEVSDDDKLLVAAGAVIPVFGFKDWDYDNLDEVLIYPQAFTTNFRRIGKGRAVLGMVGEGVMSGRMILSKAALQHGFRNNRDRKNVAIHEFTHLVDMIDGAADGVLEETIRHDHFVEPWLELMRHKMLEINHGKSDIRAYGGTHPREFLAVVSEYFFERPEKLKKEHPKVYAYLRKFYQQDPAQLFKKARARQRRKKSVDQPCYCGSNRRYSDCHGIERTPE